MPVVELLVSAILPVLFEKLASPELWQFLRQEGLHSKIKTLEETLMMIQAVLCDAEEKQLKQKGVQEWLDRLEDLAYDVEDILDEFATDVLARKLEMENHDQASSSKVRRKFVPGFVKKLSPRRIKFHTRMGSEIKDVKRRLKRVTSQLEELHILKDDLGLEKNEPSAPDTSVIVHQRQPTTCIPIEPAVYGRDEDKAKILKMVFENEPSAFNFHVISIVGMGGIGKTTLAREVYNDETAKSFELKAWVCISYDFDVLRISKAILEFVTKSNIPNNLSAVQIQLQKEFAGKKFLLVLDDIWSNDYSSWELLRSPFKAGASGSKIIVTTRHEDVALTMGHSTRLYRLKYLSNDDCWSLFKAHAFEDGVNSTHHDIQSIRQKVVEKSKGLPLASRILGGLLRAKQIDKWLEILNSEMWDFEDKSEIPTTLKLSYFYLPSYLKRCFAHFAILPENCEFQEKEVILLWIAEGLIQPLNENKQLEALGLEYFNDLLSRSFFQQSSRDESKYMMHDLVNDLARWASRGTCFHLEDKSRANKQLGSLKKVRHFSYVSNFFDGICKFEVISEVKRADECLRTFLPLSVGDFWQRYLSRTMISNWLPKFKKLRMLSLEGYHITELPESFGDLKHLRCLNLSSTGIKSLPESVSFLINLLILKLTCCYNLKKLPSKIRNLTKLRHLDIRGVSLDEMPLGIHELKCLHYLSNLIVSKGVGATLKDLKNLKSLCGELCISGLSNAVDLQEISEAILNDKQTLEVLKLDWNYPFDDTRNEEIEKKVLDMLCPHPNLKGLEIKFYGGIEFPSWVGDASFSKLTTVTLIGCDNCKLLPSLGLLASLKDLTITGMNGLKSIGKEFCGQRCSRPFQSLETLCFHDMQEWEHWEPIKENEHGGAFFRLREFSVINCPKLCERLPDYLPSLEKFVVENCKQLVVSLSGLPMLCNLDINNCKKIVCNSPIDSRSLDYMTNSNIPELGCSSRHDCFQGVKHLCISNTSHEQFTNLWQMNGASLERPPQRVQNFISITDLQITSCSDLVSFPEVCFLSNIYKLVIRDCNALTSLPVEMNHKNACLESLEIERCDSLRFIVNGQLPSSLKRLEIYGCDELEYLWDDREISCTSILDKENNVSLLEYLQVCECKSLTSLSLSARLPVTLCRLRIFKLLELESIADNFQNNKSLKVLTIFGCIKLKTIPKGLYNLSRLRLILIHACQSIVNFAEDGLPKDGLNHLHITDCEKLEGPPKGFHSLNSLENLELIACPSMRSFPEEGFPTNLTSLQIDDNVNLYKPLLEWGLHKLTSLTTLYLYGGQEAELSVLEQDMGKRLPHSLTHLYIHRFPNVKWVLSQGLRNLELLDISGSPTLTSFPKVVLSSSLRSLSIWDCPGLTSISELGLPSSLQRLSISDCPGLTSISELGLPSSLQFLEIRCCPGFTSLLEQRLPSSLLKLEIWGCPRLKEECKRNKGKAWPKISHIPCIMIDDESIYELEDGE